jgi:hypothetical protein
MTIAERAAQLMAMNKSELAQMVAELEAHVVVREVPAAVVAAEAALHEAVEAAQA